jgi:hypothetical protein
MDFLKTIGGKIATGIVALAVGAAGLAWYETDPTTKHAILSDTGRILGWSLLVLILPWASFALVSWVAKFDTNTAGAGLVLGMTVVQALVLAWLFGWSVHGATVWTVYAAAVLIAGVYNLFACDWIAERVG